MCLHKNTYQSINECTRNHEMLRDLVLRVVDHWMHGYQLSEEALLEGVRGGIRDIALMGTLLCKAPGR